MTCNFNSTKVRLKLMVVHSNVIVKKNFNSTKVRLKLIILTR